MMSATSPLTGLTEALRALDSGSPNPEELQRLGRRVRRARRDGVIETGLSVRVISSFATDMLGDALAGALLRHGITANVALAPYGALPRELIGVIPAADLLMLLPTHRDLMRQSEPGATAAQAEEAAADEARFWADLWPTNSPVVQLTFDPPPTRALSEGDGFLPGGRLCHVRAVNRHLAALAPANVALVDTEALVAEIGPDWHSPRTYALCKQPFGTKAAATLAEALAAEAAGLLGKARKVLVLDLDNTIWGGTVGDVGTGGLILGMESAEAEAFVNIQLYAKALARRGVILAVCSKNDEGIARRAFDTHSAMILRSEDIASFVANFDDKATNLRRIAGDLNVGLDSMVFVDDNPIERAWVKDQLPEVLVIDLPAEPADYVTAIERARCFPMQRLTREDLTRTQSYAARSSLHDAASHAGDMDAFLAGLDPQAIWSRAPGDEADRIVQLLGKTNQFRISGRARGANELVAHEMVAISLSDRMQQYGIVAVVLLDRTASEISIVQWVMSCRVFGRRLEHATIEVLRGIARGAGCTVISLLFEPSTKNGVARDYLLAAGFREAGGKMTITVGAPPAAPHHMTITERPNHV